MSIDATKYLATQILSEQRTVSYRNVARACKVHANTAKCMLYEFYHDQSTRKPGSLYATYLIAGVKKANEPVQNGATNGHHEEDEPVPSSPPPFTSSMLEPSQRSEARDGVPRKVITLFRQEAIDDVKSQYESISSIHIYSLSPTKLQDLVVLTDVGRGLYTDFFAKEDPLLHNRTYGVIQNPQVRRRKGKRPMASPASAPKFQPVKEQSKPVTNPPPSSKNDDTTSRPSSRDSTSTHDAKAPTLKRGGSDLFKAFAKSQPPKPKTDSQDTTMSGQPAPKLSDEEGESEDEALFLDTGTRQPAKKRASDAKKEREDKAAKLRKMMDSDDDEAAAVPKVEDAAADADGPVATDKLDGEQDTEGNVVWSDSEGESKVTKNKDEVDVAEQAGPRRRRGKRKVMKKKTMKDEDGYLVTKEEAVWESFSESEPEMEKKKPAPRTGGFAGKSQSSSQKSAATDAKSGAKKGKGDIMSFFGKK